MQHTLQGWVMRGTSADIIVEMVTVEEGWVKKEVRRRRMEDWCEKTEDGATIHQRRFYSVLCYLFDYDRRAHFMILRLGQRNL